MTQEHPTMSLYYKPYNIIVWSDPRLKWDPAKYGGLNTIRIQPSKVWTPGIILYNARDGQVRS